MNPLIPPENLGLFFDTETTGLPQWKIPSDDPSQPHMTEIGAIVADMRTGEEVHALSVIIKPDGWIIPEVCVELNGITTEYADAAGILEMDALGMFLTLGSGIKRFAFNTTFDNRIIRIATKRYLSAAAQDVWKGGEYECMMIASRKAIGGKNPTLEVAYEQICGKTLVGAHRAINDAMACKEIYFKLNPPGQAKAPKETVSHETKRIEPAAKAPSITPKSPVDDMSF